MSAPIPGEQGKARQASWHRPSGDARRREESGMRVVSVQRGSIEAAERIGKRLSNEEAW